MWIHLLLREQKSTKIHFVASGNHTKDVVQFILQGVTVGLPNATLRAQLHCFWEIYQNLPHPNQIEHILSQTIADKEVKFLEMLRNGDLMKINTSSESDCVSQAKL